MRFIPWMYGPFLSLTYQLPKPHTQEGFRGLGFGIQGVGYFASLPHPGAITVGGIDLG